jgi:7,8-dihydropterin-6-yl-methyl-4-(beta-D-ribofuranosyl)aminobenzene 5'-phosphate synthase
MCDDDTSGVRAAVPRPVTGAAVDPVPLAPVDEVVITTLVDNTFDALLPGDDRVRRAPIRAGLAEAPQFEDGLTTVGLRAEHGFSALVRVRRGDAVTTLLFDTGVSPDGMVSNAERLGLELGDVQGVVLSHGHFDHAGGLAGLAGRRGVRGLPMTVHPLVWTRRRLAPPGLDPAALPTLSRRALEAEGFQVIERRFPSLLVGGSVLITGEVDRTTGFERGMPPAHQAWDGADWRHDPLVLDDQALVVHLRGLRARRRRQHRAARAAADRRRPAARARRRPAPERPRLRADHRAHGQRADRDGSGPRRQRALQRLARPAGTGRRAPRGLGAQQFGHVLPARRLIVRQEDG